MLIGDETIAGAAECLTCSCEWLVAWPLGWDALQCPECGSDDTVREPHALFAYPRRPLSHHLKH